MNISKNTAKKGAVAPIKQRNYNEIVAYLNDNWAISDTSKTLDRMKKLDQALGSVAKKTDAILIAGTNGKSLTMHFATKLLQAEGLKVGSFFSPHILTYNERITIDQAIISNKNFTELGNEVINMAESLKLKANSYELLTMMSLLYFKNQNVDVVLLEVNEGGTHNAVNICDAKVATITRVTATDIAMTDEQVLEATKDIMGIVKKGTWIVSGDQSKAHLQLMQQLTEKLGGQWAMPIRKLAPLNYPFEQLHGRCAALAERISQLFVNNVELKNTTITTDGLLVKEKGQRGRPTLAAKREAELNPKKTIEQFWRETLNTLPGRFQLLDKEKPSILLDNANNIDAFTNLLLGVRLLHYQRPLQGLTIIVGAAHNTLHSEEFLKLVRYFFKKTSGELFVCPLSNTLPGNHEETSWDVDQVTNDVKSMKIKARAFNSFEEAFEVAKASVDERQGLVVIAGSQSIINSYWCHKGIKKLG